MATIIGPDFVTLPVRDMEASRRFYTEQRGPEPAPQSSSGAVVFGTAPIPVAVREPMFDFATATRLGVALPLTCYDAGVLCASLLRQGVAIVQQPFGRTSAFAAADRYPIAARSGGR